MNPRHIVALIALATLAALVALVLLRPPVTAPTADGQSPATEPMNPREVLPAVDPRPWPRVTWDAIETPFVAQPSLIRVDGVIDGTELLIAWGRASTPNRNQFNDMGAVFVSVDGRSWRTKLIEHGVERLNTSDIRGVAVGPHGYLAYGSVCCEPERRAAWHSADGQEWVRLEVGGDLDAAGMYLENVVGVAEGWVAMGTTLDGQEGRIWTSTDGVGWEIADGIDGATLADLAPGPDGLIAVGTVDGPDDSFDGAVWTSPDGRAWRRLAAEDPALAGPGETQLRSVVAHAGGYFVTGGHGTTEQREQCEQLGMLASTDPQPPMFALSCVTGEEQTWVSSDGETWERIDPMAAPGEHPIEFRMVVAGGLGLVLLGESSPPESPDTTLFTSPDGKRWTAVGPPQPIGNGVVMGLVVRERDLLAVAEHFDGNRSRWRVWLGSAN